MECPSKRMRIATWNVNGIRACCKKGFLDWFQREKFQIVCLQEIKAQKEQIPAGIRDNTDYTTNFASAQQKGYSGVGILSHKSIPCQVSIGLGVKQFDQEGRTIVAEYPSFILINGYFPNGGREHKRVPFKLKYSQTVADLALSLQKTRNKPVIVAGDFNTAHGEIDLKNPKANMNTTGFLPKEREWMDHFIQQGFFDLFRLKHPKKQEYTWWTYRNNCRERNIGWRIDYFFSTKDLLDSVRNVHHCPQIKGSDHCPVVLTLDI